MRDYEYTAFDYKTPSGRTKKVYKPLLEVHPMKRGFKVIPVRCLLDSGADTIIFPAQAATFFKIDYKKCKKVRSEIAGGGHTHFYRVPYSVHKIELMVSGKKNPIHTSIDFSEGQNLPLLGQDFFDYYIITFNRGETKFSL